MAQAQTIRSVARSPSVAREFFVEQLPLVAVVLGLGLAAAYMQHGFLPGGDVAFPLAKVRVPIWHIVWMGFWTGYTMAVVGQGAGIFALPYTMSVLQFANPHVTPTMQLVTFLNPLGALFGFRASRQWNLDFALWVCLGGVLGGLIGPFVRLTVLSEVRPFTLSVGLALSFAGVYLCYAARLGLLRKNPIDGIEAKFAAEMKSRRAAGLPPSGIPADIGVETVSKGGGYLTVGFWGQTWTVNLLVLFLIGFVVGIVSTAIGLGGGFMLVPIFAAIYGMPMYVLVAATIPFVIVLSAVGLFAYSVILPAMAGSTIQPEWAWGFFAAGGGILGSWAAAKTQRFVPEHLLKLMLGGITSVVGGLYVISFFYELPFRL